MPGRLQHSNTITSLQWIGQVFETYRPLITCQMLTVPETGSWYLLHWSRVP